MRLPHQLLLFLTLSLSHLISASLTFQTIRNLTTVTDECRARIVATDRGENVVQILGGGQVVLQSGHEDGGEVEDTIAAALRVLCSDLLVELEKDFPPEQETKKPKCQIVIKEYHEFLGATVKFLHEVQERQMLWHWGGESAVFDGVAWLKGLWASRSANKQDRSFIEQQMLLYDYKGSGSCFGKSEEVLLRDVEIVEYMNDLIDSFN